MKPTLPWLIPVAPVAAREPDAMPGLLSAHVLPAPIEVTASSRNLARPGALWTNTEVAARPGIPGFVVGGGISFTLGIGAEAKVFPSALGALADSAARSPERNARRWNPTYAKA